MWALANDCVPQFISVPRQCQHCSAEGDHGGHDAKSCDVPQCHRATPMRERLLGDPRMRDRRKLRDNKAFLPLTKSLVKPKLRTGGGKCQNVELGRGAGCSRKTVRREALSPSLLHRGWGQSSWKSSVRVCNWPHLLVQLLAPKP